MEAILRTLVICLVLIAGTAIYLHAPSVGPRNILLISVDSHTKWIDVHITV